MHDITSAGSTGAAPFMKLSGHRMCTVTRLRSSQSISSTLAVEETRQLLCSSTLSDELLWTLMPCCEGIEASSGGSEQ